jgi:SagB-type dehydrogenase family enzyme
MDKEQWRAFLKDTIRQEVDFSQTDQNRGLAPPPIEKPSAPQARRIDLPGAGQFKDLVKIDLFTAINRRESVRSYRPGPLALKEVAFLLWATQGIRHVLDPGHALRTVPSAGCRHALETYLCVLNVTGLEQGLYRYLPLEHQLVFEFAEQDLARKMQQAVLGQPYPGSAALTFIWTTIPYRMEWRYGPAAYKVIALEAGHVCQNLYLACEAIGCGTCAIAAYDQPGIDRLLRVDGREEFTIYLAPVGRK